AAADGGWPVRRPADACAGRARLFAGRAFGLRRQPAGLGRAAAAATGGAARTAAGAADAGAVRERAAAAGVAPVLRELRGGVGDPALPGRDAPAAATRSCATRAAVDGAGIPG